MLHSDLAFSYNGSYIRHSFDRKSTIKGVVLTDTGQVYSRDDRSNRWDHIRTPELFYFYDSESEITYLVDSKKKHITATIPTGRILDCTDQVIYDIGKGSWCPVYDVANKKPRSIIKCDRFGGSLFNTIGDPVEIVEELSDFDSEDVDLLAGLIQRGVIPPGECKTLTYRTVLEKESMIVTQLFIAKEEIPLFSAVYGHLNTIPSEDLEPQYNKTGIATPIDKNMYKFIDWTLERSVPEKVGENRQFDFLQGDWIVPVDGDYKVSIGVGLDSGGENSWIALVRYTSESATGKVVGSSLITGCVGNLNIITPLEQSDHLALYLVSSNIHETVPSSTLFNAYALNA